MKPTTAICCICDREVNEKDGTYSLPYEQRDEPGALFICNACQQQEDRLFPDLDVSGFPVDWDEGMEDEDNAQFEE